MAQSDFSSLRGANTRKGRNTFTSVRIGSAVTAILLFGLLALYLRSCSGDQTSAAIWMPNFEALLEQRSAAGLPIELELAWESDAAPSHEARAIRLGARAADLAGLVRARNFAAADAYYRADSAALATVDRASALIAVFAAEIDRELVSESRGAAARAPFLRMKADAQRQSTITWSDLTQGRRSVFQVNPRWVVLGNWLEYARIAAHHDDQEFFRQNESQVLLDAANTLTMCSTAFASLFTARELIQRDTIDTAALQGALTDALVSLGGGEAGCNGRARPTASVR